MTSFPGSPQLIKGGIVLIDVETSAVDRVIALQYNPDTLTRTLQVQGIDGGGEGGGGNSQALRLTGPPVETIKLDAEIDATDQLEFPDQNETAAEYGVSPQLAVLETIIYPASSRLQANNELARQGTLEIIPMETPLMLFVWNRSRVLPVRLTEFSVTEEAFDAALNPIRAKVSLGMRVLSIDDLGFEHKGGSLYMVYQQQKEKLADKSASGLLSTLGIGEAL